MSTPASTHHEKRFEAGDFAYYTNDYGVYWGVRKIVSFDTQMLNADSYIISPTDTPWCPVHARNLKRLNDEENQMNAYHLSYLAEDWHVGELITIILGKTPKDALARFQTANPNCSRDEILALA